MHWQVALVYLEDIVIISKSSWDHIEQAQRILQLPYNAGVTLKLKKCHFFAETINYFSQVIRPGHLELAEYTTDAIAKLKDHTA